MDDDTTGRLPDEASQQPPESGETASGVADAAETAVTSPGAGETSVAPPHDDAATRVMSGEAVAATQVMSAGDAGSSPPPLRPQPTLMMSRPPNQSSGTWWIVLVVVLLALVAVAAAWYFLIRDKGEQPAPQPSPAFDWEGAWGRTDGTGGGVVVEPSGKDYKVTVYGSTLQVLGSATATPKGKDLAFSLESAESVGGLPSPFQIILQAGPGEDLADMKVTGGNQTTVIVPLKRVAALVPIAPSASPTSSPSSSPSASPSAGTDQQVIDAIDKLQTGVITWATNNNNLYPTPTDVSQAGGIAAYVDPWPTNPYTSQPMKPGTQPGDYTYEQLNGGAGYKLTGYISNGLTYTVP
ncbi:MAG: hypothetical protein NTX16_05005 [Actinobacteria bacterium]|nr:hypothetical protein [Actinomycetota bacterium]